MWERARVKKCDVGVKECGVGGSEGYCTDISNFI